MAISVVVLFLFRSYADGLQAAGAKRPHRIAATCGACRACDLFQVGVVCETGQNAVRRFVDKACLLK